MLKTQSTRPRGGSRPPTQTDIASRLSKYPQKRCFCFQVPLNACLRPSSYGAVLVIRNLASGDPDLSPKPQGQIAEYSEFTKETVTTPCGVSS